MKTKIIEVRKIGDLSARFVNDGGIGYVELFVRLKSADSPIKTERAKPATRRKKAAKTSRRAKPATRRKKAAKTSRRAAGGRKGGRNEN